MKALIYSYVGRKHKKRNFRKLWICRINAASRSHGIAYSQLRNLMKKSSIKINLKMLAQIALLDEKAFSYIIKTVDN